MGIVSQYLALNYLLTIHATLSPSVGLHDQFCYSIFLWRKLIIAALATETLAHFYADISVRSNAQVLFFPLAVILLKASIPPAPIGRLLGSILFGSKVLLGATL